MKKTKITELNMHVRISDLNIIQLEASSVTVTCNITPALLTLIYTYSWTSVRASPYVYYTYDINPGGLLTSDYFRQMKFVVQWSEPAGPGNL